MITNETQRRDAESKRHELFEKKARYKKLPYSWTPALQAELDSISNELFKYHSNNFNQPKSKRK